MPRTIPTLATAAALGLLAVPAVAQASPVSAQRTYAGRTAPVTFAGTGLARGAKIPAGDRIVLRKVTLSQGQKPKTTLTAPRGTHLLGLAADVDHGGDVGFGVIGSSHYVGKRRVRVGLFARPKASAPATGVVYALAGR